jgi:hypothetical protein
MRIIDKLHDFYDYLQDPTDTIVFDRRGSYQLTKELFLNKIAIMHPKSIGKFSIKYPYLIDFKQYLILQCGATYWLICAQLNEDNSDYTLELLYKWKNYNKPRVIIELYTIDDVGYYSIDKNRPLKKISDDHTINTILNGYYNKRKVISNNIKNNNGKEEIQTIPILSSCGIADIVDPVDIFTAIEEHFSLLKTESERTEPIDASNDDKITMHGFDTKTSFRGKNK